MRASAEKEWFECFAVSRFGREPRRSGWKGRLRLWFVFRFAFPCRLPFGWKKRDKSMRGWAVLCSQLCISSTDISSEVRYG
jgi:hypothetical protein